MRATTIIDFFIEDEIEFERRIIVGPCITIRNEGDILPIITIRFCDKNKLEKFISELQTLQLKWAEKKCQEKENAIVNSTPVTPAITEESKINT